MRTNRTNMQVSIEAILKAHGQLHNFNTPNKNGAYEFHLNIVNQPYMPLVIERHGTHAMISHFFMQNGDVMSDPEIVFALPAWEAVEITQSPMGVFRRKYVMQDGHKMKHIHFARDVEPLVHIWARNLREQGFAHGTATSLTHVGTTRPA